MPSDGKKLKILIVSQFYYPDITACAFRIHETAKFLADMGHEIHIIGGEPHKGNSGEEINDDPRLKVLRVPIYKNVGGKWNYIRHYLSFMFGAIKASRKLDSNYDAIWASSPPLFVGIAGWAIAFEKKCKFCLDIRDIWPESAVVAGQIKKDGVLFRAAKIVEKLLYKFADKITCVAKPMAEYIKSIAPNAEPVVIYNSIPSELIPTSNLEIATEPNCLNILYIGNMGFCQNLGLVLDAAKILSEKGEQRIKFTMVGAGVEKQLLQQRISDEKLTNVEILDVVSKKKAVEMTGTADALMLHLKDDGTMDKTIPSKVFDYLAGGKPILYGLRGEAAEILQRTEGNIYYETSQDLADAAITLLDNYNEYASKAAYNRKLVKDEFLREKMTEKLANSVFQNE